MKILHITSSFMPPKIEGDLEHSSHINTNDEGDSYAGARIGGIAKVIEDFSNAFSEFESHVLLSNDISPTDVMRGIWKGSMLTDKRDNLSIHYFPNSGLIQNRKEVNYTIQGILEKEYEDFNFDVVITHVINPHYDLSNVNKKCKLINFTHGSKTNLNLSESHMNAIDVNLLFTEYHRDFLEDNSKSVIIPLPVNTELFYPRGIKKDDFVWCGRIAPEKRIIDLAVMFEDNVNSNLTVIGGPDNKAWVEDIKHSDLEKVSFVGRKFDESLAEELSKHKYFVLPSKYETYCLAILEALASGCSVYATHHKGMDWAKDYITFAENLEGLIELINNPTHKDYSQSIVENFSWDVLKPKYLDLLMSD